MGLDTPTPKRKRRKEEQGLQERLVQVLAMALPKNCFFFAVPNGGSRHVLEGVALKKQGVVAGVPDLVFVWQGRFVGLELKSKYGEVRPVQVDVHHKIIEAGGRVEVARSIGEACDRLRECGIPVQHVREVA
ncbi:MAG: VRR-NUC domain-containing protein [Alphaproteobacteria bacterium]|nr:VRR-NUC domain-containing protein [Alphaproteobacteria bacterium]